MKKYLTGGLIGLVIALLLLASFILGLRTQDPQVIETLGGRTYETGKTILDASEAVTTSSAFSVADYRHIGLNLNGITESGGQDSVYTIRILGSLQQDPPDFTSPKSTTSSYDYIEIVDLEDGTVIDGDTGVSLTAQDQRIYEVNVNQLKWLGAAITSYTSGTSTLIMFPANNQ